MVEIENKEVRENSILVLISYGAHQTFSQGITGAFGLYVFFYYEVEIGLNVVFATIALAIFSIWNAVNDPIMDFTRLFYLLSWC